LSDSHVMVGIQNSSRSAPPPPPRTTACPSTSACCSRAVRFEVVLSRNPCDAHVRLTCHSPTCCQQPTQGPGQVKDTQPSESWLHRSPQPSIKEWSSRYVTPHAPHQPTHDTGCQGLARPFHTLQSAPYVVGRPFAMLTWKVPCLVASINKKQLGWWRGTPFAILPCATISDTPHHAISSLFVLSLARSLVRLLASASNTLPNPAMSLLSRSPSRCCVARQPR
jgi:hypothetical protein